MDLTALILFGVINAAMVISCLRGAGWFYRFPFWAGVLALGWFYPQAIGGYLNASEFPPEAFTDSMAFASLCTGALWLGFDMTLKRSPRTAGWLGCPFDARRLYYAGAALCLFGFYFQWKLWSLPEEMLLQSQWSGATVRYHFLGNVFKIGFATLWILYISQRKLYAPRFLVFIVPGLLLFLEAAIFRGRRAGMMDLISYLMVSLWFVRRVAVPRWLIITGLSVGLVLVNGIHTYRLILLNKEATLSERLSEAVHADYFETLKKLAQQSGYEFKNYVFFRQIYVDERLYDFGASHWNYFVFNYVPGQIIGKENKESLMIRPGDVDVKDMAYTKYGHKFHIGTTTTGYKDSFGSFGWLGFVKYLIIGSMMGALYRYAFQGAFLGQLLYIYALTTAMQSISHGTNDVLVRIWVYFFALGYPALYWAKRKGGRSLPL